MSSQGLKMDAPQQEMPSGNELRPVSTCSVDAQVHEAVPHPWEVRSCGYRLALVQGVTFARLVDRLTTNACSPVEAACCTSSALLATFSTA